MQHRSRSPAYSYIPSFSIPETFVQIRKLREHPVSLQKTSFQKTVSSKCRYFLCPKNFFIFRKIRTCSDFAYSSSALPLPQRGWCYHHTGLRSSQPPQAVLAAGGGNRIGQSFPWGTALLLLPAWAVGYILPCSLCFTCCTFILMCLNITKKNTSDTGEFSGKPLVLFGIVLGWPRYHRSCLHRAIPLKKSGQVYVNYSSVCIWINWIGWSQLNHILFPLRSG